MKKLLLNLLFLGLCFLKTQGVFAQNPNTFSCAWQPETNKCVENLSLNTCQNGFESNPQVCTVITNDSTCYQTHDQPCVSSDLPASRWKCVGGNCYPCTASESCLYENSSMCNQACTSPPTSTPIPPRSTATPTPPPFDGGGSRRDGGASEEGIDFEGIAKDLKPTLGLKDIFLPGPATNVTEIISAILPYLFVIAGLLLLFYLIYGGFHMMIAANDEKGLAEAKGKITNALVGFMLLFVSYWLVQILGYILGIQIF